MSAPLIFDRSLQISRQLRHAREFSRYSFLYKAVFEEMSERLLNFNRRFERTLALNLRVASFLQALKDHPHLNEVIHLQPYPSPAADIVGHTDLLAARGFDLIFSLFDLQNINDVPGALIQYNLALNPDGLFLAAFPGGQSLHELSHALSQAEMNLYGGISPRVHPMLRVEDASALVTRAALALPVVDTYTLTITYPDLFSLMRDLRGMGLSNTLMKRSRKPATRTFFAEAERIYRQNFMQDGQLRLTFEILNIAAWAPAASQQKPLRPGTARARLSEALETKEVSAGEKTGKP